MFSKLEIQEQYMYLNMKSTETIILVCCGTAVELGIPHAG